MTTIQVITNTFEITKLPRSKYKHYDGWSTPDNTEVYAYKRNLLFAHLMDVVDPIFFDKRPIFDGKSIAYSPKDLGPNRQWTISLGSTTPVEPNKKGAVTIRITAAKPQLVDPSHVKDLIEGGRNTDRAIAATNLMQLVVRQAANKNKTNNGRASFASQDALQFRNKNTGVEVWLGFFQSVRPTPQRMVLNIDTVSAVVYKQGSLLSLTMQLMETKDAHRLRLQERDLEFKKLQDYWKGVEIILPAAGGKRRNKKIRGLVPSAAEYRFSNDEGLEMTVKDYWEYYYRVAIRHRGIVGVRLTGRNHPRPQVVPLEVCEVPPGQLFKKKLPDSLVGEMVRFSAVSPAERWARIQRGADQHKNSQHLAESGMEISRHPVIAQGLLLPVPNLEYARNSRPVIPHDGKWNVMNTQFHDPKPLEFWGLVNFCPGVLGNNDVEQIINAIRMCSRNLGMSQYSWTLLQREDRDGAPPSIVYPTNPQSTNYKESLDAAMKGLMGARPEANDKVGTIVLIILLPENAATIRDAVKGWGDQRRGIITMCAREGKLKRKPGDNQYWNNIMLKINARLGGRNSIVKSPILTELKRTPYMIMGADVGHPGVGVQRPSTTGLVYSHDEDATQYAAITGIQSPRVEVIEDLFNFVAEAVDSFGSKNQAPPHKVFFFRDGLSEGEFTKVAEIEIYQIKKAFKAVFAERKIMAPLPLLVYIIVGKRHHITLYSGNREAGDKTGNCPAGTVVHSEITHPAYKDFYLQSHAAIQGTSRSSHYTVIEDQVWDKKRIDLIEQLAFSLCHVYAKATRSVSIPAPVYYADLVCSRLNFHMDPNMPAHLWTDTASTSSRSGPSFNLDLWKKYFRPVHPRLSKTMYFL